MEESPADRAQRRVSEVRQRRSELTREPMTQYDADVAAHEVAEAKEYAEQAKEYAEQAKSRAAARAERVRKLHQRSPRPVFRTD